MADAIRGLVYDPVDITVLEPDPQDPLKPHRIPMHLNFGVRVFREKDPAFPCEPEMVWVSLTDDCKVLTKVPEDSFAWEGKKTICPNPPRSR